MQLLREILADRLADVIEVRRQAGDHMPAATWVISRRYSEFHELNKRLRAKFPQVRHLELPRRQMMLKLQKDFLKKRRIGLEKYLRVNQRLNTVTS
jgi:sorting nexin-25